MRLISLHIQQEGNRRVCTVYLQDRDTLKIFPVAGAVTEVAHYRIFQDIVLNQYGKPFQYFVGPLAKIPPYDRKRFWMDTLKTAALGEWFWQAVYPDVHKTQEKQEAA